MHTLHDKQLKISKLTLGTVQLGMTYGINNQAGRPTEQSSFDILSEAWSGGVVSFDTASAYGQSERILGQFFRGKSPTIITKIHIAPDNTDKARIEYEMRMKAEASLEQLRLPSIPILMLHNTDAMKDHGDAITAGFQSLIKTGLISHAGISVTMNIEQEYKTIWKYLQNDTYEAVQIPMNVLDHRPLNNGCLPMLNTAGKIVFVRSVFLQGLLFMQAHQLPVHLSGAGESLSRLQAMSAKYGMSLAQIAVSFIRDLEGVHSIVAGAETIEQVRENLRWIDGPSLPEPLREEIMSEFRNVPELWITPALWNKN